MLYLGRFCLFLACLLAAPLARAQSDDRPCNRVSASVGVGLSSSELGSIVSGRLGYAYGRSTALYIGALVDHAFGTPVGTASARNIVGGEAGVDIRWRFILVRPYAMAGAAWMSTRCSDQCVPNPQDGGPNLALGAGVGAFLMGNGIFAGLDSRLLLTGANDSTSMVVLPSISIVAGVSTP